MPRRVLGECPRVFGTDNKLSAYRFAQFNVQKQEAISCVRLRRINPWALMAILILASTMHEGLIGPELNAELTCQDVDLESHTLAVG